jgi:predicted Fe-S protein YdhL (DUF1289 family)
MKFSPCTSECTTEGDTCLGCGRTHVEIAETKKVVATIVQHIKKYDYENPELFVAMLGKKTLAQTSK